MSGNKGIGALLALPVGGGFSGAGQEIMGQMQGEKGRSTHPLSSMFGMKPDKQHPTDPGNDPSVDAAAQAQRDEEERLKLQQATRGGRASTILTGSGMDRMGGSSTRRALFGE